jgi:hypothetical protein
MFGVFENDAKMGQTAIWKYTLAMCELWHNFNPKKKRQP